MRASRGGLITIVQGGNPLRPNPLKPRLAAGGCAFGTMTFEFFTPGYPAICREAGAEFISTIWSISLQWRIRRVTLVHRDRGECHSR